MRIFAGLLVAVLPAFCQPVTPFAVTEISRRVDMPSQSVKESKFLFAMNRDGSIVSVDLDPSSGGARQIIDVVKHRTIVVNPNARSAAMSPHGYQPQNEPREACEQRFRSAVGAAVSVDRSAARDPGGIIAADLGQPDVPLMEILVAPSLACHIMETRTFRDGLFLETRTTENLQIGDPDPHLFEIPADYRVTEAAWLGCNIISTLPSAGVGACSRTEARGR